MSAAFEQWIKPKSCAFNRIWRDRCADGRAGFVASEVSKPGLLLGLEGLPTVLLLCDAGHHSMGTTSPQIRIADGIRDLKGVRIQCCRR